MLVWLCEGVCIRIGNRGRPPEKLGRRLGQALPLTPSLAVEHQALTAASKPWTLDKPLFLSGPQCPPL